MSSPVSPRGVQPKPKDVGPLTIAADDPAVLKHGILWKQGGSIKSWKKRFFYLYGKANFRNVVLTYHKKPNEPAIDELPLEGASVELPDPGTHLNFKPRGQTRVYPFKSPNDSSEELMDWYSAILEHTTKLEEMLFPGTTTTVSTMHVFSTLQDRFGAKPAHIKVVFAKLGVDFNASSIAREPLCKLLRFLPPIRKENSSNQADSPTANLDVLSTNRCGNTLSHWARLMQQPWFFMYKDNLSVYQYLANKEIGSFVVRFGRFDDVFVLTVKTPGEIIHLPVTSTPAGFGLPNAAHFPTIYGFLRNYVNQPLPSGISLVKFPVAELTEDLTAGGGNPGHVATLADGSISSSHFANLQHSGSSSSIKGSGKKEKKHKKKDTDPGTPPLSPASGRPMMRPPPPPSDSAASSSSPGRYGADEDMDAPPSLGPVPDILEPPPSLATPSHHPAGISATISTVGLRLTTAFEVPASPAKSYAEPWKIPSSLAKADGWKTAKHGLCRRILLQKGLKVVDTKEMEQLSHILRILSPEGPIRILKCYALENSRLVTLFDANNSFLEAKLKTYATEQPKWAAQDPTGARTETNQVLDYFGAKCSWNKDKSLKVLPMIFFASEEKLQTVEAEGFDKSQENPEGPYGAGYYLSRSLEEARYKTNNGPFIVAFAAPGRVYPVIEQPINPNAIVDGKKGRASVGAAPATLWGKPVKDGYDAHFVRTCGSTKDDPSAGKVFHNGWAGSEWDQLVLFSMVQAVPRYLVYLE